MPMKNLCLSIALLAAAVLPAGAQESGVEPFSAEHLVMMDRISSTTVSPDGEHVAFVVRHTDLEANRGRTDLYLMESDGEDLRRLTADPAGDWNPVWAPDSQWIYFLSSRSGSSQVWRIRVDGGEAQQVSDLPLDVGDMKLSPDGRQVAFSMEVFVDCPDLECTTERLEEREEDGRSGMVYDQLFVRHWDTWKDGRRRHLFVARVLDDGTIDEPIDVMPDMDADSPSKPFGGASEYTFTPDGTGIVFTARNAGAEEPWSTNFDLYHSLILDPRPQNLTTDNEAWDTTPVFSPDGSALAFLSMRVPGYEADRYRIVTRNWESTGNQPKVGPRHWVSEDWDRSAYSLGWTEDGRAFLSHANHLGRRALFRIDARTGESEILVDGGSVKSEEHRDGRIYFAEDDFRSPVQIFSIDEDGGDRKQLTDFNAERLAKVAMGEPEQFTFTGANGDEVYAWIVKPANFDPDRTYPVAFLIHGGPQGSFGQGFHYRWNPQTYAGAGYASVMVDFHGSTGYGQDFTDSIQDNWGGWPLEDLQKGLAAALERYPWMDDERVAALGASYGGYMINWIAGNWPERFTCLVNHDGLFDLESMYYSTEELWFPEREFGGQPWNSRAYERWSPSNHVEKWQTPMLVIHGELDYRVPISEGLQTFTALQRRGIPSRLLYFPDENHWVLQPENSLMWHEEVIGWIDRWTKPGGAR